MANEFKYEIHEELLVLSTKNGWDKLLTNITWGDGEPVYDIRSWNAERTRCGKGITLTEDELKLLCGDYYYDLTGNYEGFEESDDEGWEEEYEDEEYEEDVL